MGPCGTLLDHKGPYRTIRDHTGPYSTVRDHSGLLHARVEKSVTHRLTDSLTDSQVRSLEGHAPPIISQIQRGGERNNEFFSKTKIFLLQVVIMLMLIMRRRML